MDVTVCIGTFGDRTWIDRARRAVQSVPNDVAVVHAHRDTLAEARNAALAQVKTTWVVHLDADDELTDGYFDAMFAGSADVRGPVAQYVTADHERIWQPRVYAHQHDCTVDCLPDGNWLLIGSMVRTAIAQQCRWREFEWSEDWDFWLQCRALGASFELIPSAIYRAHVRPDSRNRGQAQEAKNAAHRAIYETNFGAAA